LPREEFLALSLLEAQRGLASRHPRGERPSVNTVVLIAQCPPRRLLHGAVDVMVPRHHEEPLHGEPEVLEQCLDERTGLNVLLGLAPVGHVPGEADEVERPVFQ
jgi:hypothetical protein